MLDELSVLTDAAYLWLDFAAFLIFVGFVAWTAMGRKRLQVQDTAPAVQEHQLAA
jgi:hypothetical protein